MKKLFFSAVLGLALVAPTFRGAVEFTGVDPEINRLDPSWLYLPLLFRSFAQGLSAPILNPIDNPIGDNTYPIEWSTVPGADHYILEEDTNDGFPNPIEAYNGPGTSTVISMQPAGTYYYRVRALRGSTSSGWSNIERVEVSSAPPNCPSTGSWTGSGYRFSVSFRIVWDGSQCLFQSGQGHLVATCHIPQGSTWPESVDFILQDAIIQGSHFETSSSDLRTAISGDFSGPTSVEGSLSYYEYEPSNNATCRLSGTWNGNP